MAVFGPLKKDQLKIASGQSIYEVAADRVDHVTLLRAGNCTKICTAEDAKLPAVFGLEL